jgi:hypothetical protein
MIMQRIGFGISILLLLALLVTQTGFTREKAQPCPLAFGMKHYELHATSNPDIWCKFDYPVFASSPVGDAINLVINAGILSSIHLPDDKLVPPVLEDAATTFIDECQNQSIRSQGQAAWPWQADVTVQVILDRPGMVTLALFSNTFTGDARNTSNTQYFVFDAVSGRLLGLHDLFVPGFESKLDALIEKHVRQMNIFAEPESLTQGPNEQPLKTIYHTDNFAVTGTGIMFMYNPYEIAPFSSDTIRIELSFDELRDILYPRQELKPMGQ